MFSCDSVQQKRRTTMTQTEIHLHQTATLTPEQYVAGLTDLGPGRSKLFGNSADEYLKVHHRGRSEADVTEGSGGIWERLHYDWSNPNRVVLTTTDSNVWGGAPGHTYTFTRQPNGTTDIDVAVIREGKNLKGRVLGFVAQDHRQARFGKGVSRLRQSHRSPERRGERAGRIISRVVFMRDDRGKRNSENCCPPLRCVGLPSEQ